MEVVEQPLRRGCNGLTAPNVFGEDPVGLMQYVGVVFEAGEDLARSSPLGIGAKAPAERSGAFFEPLDAEQLVTQRLGWLCAPAQE